MTNEYMQSQVDVIDDTTLLTVRGILDSVSYRPLRDLIVKAAIDEPRALIVDITELIVPAESALAVFTSARWHIARWPDVPLLLVCGTNTRRNALQRNGITRYVPVYATLQEATAIAAHQAVPGRKRARVELAPVQHSIAQSRHFVTDVMADWSRPELTPAAKVVVTALVENALRFAGGATALRLEASDDEVTVVVEDNSVIPASFRENALGAQELSSLKIVHAVSRAWGCSPTTDGKAVWCVIGPENKL